jgi:hypothetical protein
MVDKNKSEAGAKARRGRPKKDGGSLTLEMKKDVDNLLMLIDSLVDLKLFVSNLKKYRRDESDDFYYKLHRIIRTHAATKTVERLCVDVTALMRAYSSVKSYKGKSSEISFNVCDIDIPQLYTRPLNKKKDRDKNVKDLTDRLIKYSEDKDEQALKECGGRVFRERTSEARKKAREELAVDLKFDNYNALKSALAKFREERRLNRIKRGGKGYKHSAYVDFIAYTVRVNPSILDLTGPQGGET